MTRCSASRRNTHRPSRRNTARPPTASGKARQTPAAATAEGWSPPPGSRRSPRPLRVYRVQARMTIDPPEGLRERGRGAVGSWAFATADGTGLETRYAENAVDAVSGG